MDIEKRGIKSLISDMSKKNVSCNDELPIKVSMYPFIKELGTYLESLDAYQVANIIHDIITWKELHSKKELIDKRIETYNYYRYSSRDIVYVKLGGLNIGYEASYYHPAVIISQGYNWVLIAPCSTGRFGKGLNEIIDAYAAVDGVRYDTGIQADKIRVIDKWRIVNKVGRLSAKKFNKLTDKIIELHFNYHFSLIEKQKKEIDNLISEKEKMQNDINSKQNEIEKLKGIIRDYEQKSMQ